MVIIPKFKWRVRSIIVNWAKVAIPPEEIIEWGSRILLANCALRRDYVDFILAFKDAEVLEGNKTPSPFFFDNIQWVLIKTLIPMGLRYDAKAVDRADIADRDKYTEVPTL